MSALSCLFIFLHILIDFSSSDNCHLTVWYSLPNNLTIQLLDLTIFSSIWRCIWY